MLTFKRGKRKVLAAYASNDIYDYYKTHYDRVVSKSVFMKILKDLYAEIMNMIIFENLDFVLPAHMGSLRIKKKKIELSINKDGKLDKRRFTVNWKKTKEYWGKLYKDKTAEELKEIKDKPVIIELNEHSDGYRYTWFWDKTTCNALNQSAYYFDAIRKYDTLIAKASKTVRDLNYYE